MLIFLLVGKTSTLGSLLLTRLVLDLELLWSHNFVKAFINLKLLILITKPVSFDFKYKTYTIFCTKFVDQNCTKIKSKQDVEVKKPRK